jgi:hypothetical protein
MGLNEKFFKTAAADDTPNFNTVIYSGNNSNSANGNVINNVGFEPDMVFIKNRTQTETGVIVDTLRDDFGSIIYPSLNNPEPSFDNYFTRTSVGFNTNTNNLNASGTNNYVAWCWRAPTSQTNNSGTNGATITSTIKKNVAAGFSIVSYTGNSTAGAKIAHGLDYTPELFFIKNLTATSGNREWIAWCAQENAKLGYLNHPDTFESSRYSWALNSTQPNDTLITLGSDPAVNTSHDYIAYCFHSILGYSKIGAYQGNGGNQTINVGFTPQFVMIKNITQTSAYASWIIFDSERLVAYNDTNPIYANLSVAEGTRGNGTGNGDVLEIIFVTNTGFKLGDASRTNGSDELNANNEKFIYLAIA